MIDNVTKTIYRDSAHFLYVSSVSFKNDDLYAKFDTGAGVTVIGISKLYPMYDVVVEDKDEQRF